MEDAHTGELDVDGKGSAFFAVYDGLNPEPLPRPRIRPPTTLGQRPRDRPPPAQSPPPAAAFSSESVRAGGCRGRCGE